MKPQTYQLNANGPHRACSLMTRHNSKDANHNAIVRRFQDLGCSVIEMHAVGIPGMPDLACGCIGKTHLVEVKNLDTQYGRAGFNANQTAFNRDWRGEKVWLCHSEDEATAIVQNWRRAVREQVDDAKANIMGGRC